MITGGDDGTTILQKLAAQSGAEISDLDPETGAIRRRRPRGSKLKEAKTQQNLQGKGAFSMSDCKANVNVPLMFYVARFSSFNLLNFRIFKKN